MRVLVATETFLPYVSGVTVSVDALARSLGARGHEVLVLAPAPPAGRRIEPVGSPGPAPGHAWLPSYELPWLVPDGYRMPWPLPWTDALAAARRFDPEVVHAHSPFVTGLMARRLAAAAGAPLIFTHHTRFADYGHYLGPLAGPAAAVTDAYLGAYWRSCAAIVAPSTDLADEIRHRLAGERRIRVRAIATGVDVAGLRALVPRDVRGEAGWPADAVVAVTVGRLAPEKSVTILLDAIALAAVRHPALRLLVVGTGPSEPELRRRAGAPDLRGRVHFTGHLARPVALAHAAGGDLFVFASRTETQGLVLAEALGLGLPAVSVDGPGVRDSVRDGVDGIVVAAGSPAGRAERLAAAIGDLVADRGRRRRLAEAARDGAERFSGERRAGEMEDLYRELIE